jgi:hypothetical protein
MGDEPTLEDWRKLYQAARDFKEVAPWRWMADTDLFGVRDPEGQTVAYCSVLGQMGEVFGLVAYLDTEGLISFCRVAEADEEERFEAYARQNCLAAFFGSRSELTDRDRAVIKELGLRFRGSTDWPLFRRHRPGYHPWYLTAEEARLFTVVLEQAAEFCLELRDNLEILDPPQPGLVLVRVFEEGCGWRSTWFRPPPWEESLPAPTSATLDRVAQQFPRSDDCWEAGFFHVPARVVEEKGRPPVYPLVMLWVDRASGMIINLEVTKYREWEALARSFLDAVAAAGKLPARIVTPQVEVIALLKGFSKGLGIKLRQSQKVRSFAAAKRALFEHLSSRL